MFVPRFSKGLTIQ